MKSLALILCLLLTSCSSRSHIATTKSAHHKTKHNGKDRSKWEHHVTPGEKIGFVIVAGIVILLATR
jgi:hypothetical protein